MIFVVSHFRMIAFRTKAGSVTLTQLDITPGGLPRPGDRQFALELSFARLNLTGHTFWVGNNDWQTFVRLAVKLFQKRQGTAAIKSMSPGACHLVLEPVKNQKGDIKLAVNINELVAGRIGLPKFAVWIEDELESEFLLELERHLNNTNG